MKTIETRVNDLIKSAYNKTTIKMMLKAEGYASADIKKIDDLIPSKKADVIDEVEIMQMIIDCENTNMTRKQIALQLSESGLCKNSTANHIMSLMKFVRAYHDLKAS